MNDLSTSGQSGGAYGIRFFLPDRLAIGVLDIARCELVEDPHCDPSIGDGYHVNGLDIYRR